MVHLKICCNCKIEKSIDSFYRDKRRTDGRQTACKDCKSNWAKSYSIENADNFKVSRKKYRIDNKEKVKELNKNWKKQSGYRKKYFEKYHDKIMDFPSHYKKILVKMGFEDPPKELIELKRTQIKIKRLICQIEK